MIKIQIIVMYILVCDSSKISLFLFTNIQITVHTFDIFFSKKTNKSFVGYRKCNYFCNEIKLNCFRFEK